MKLPNLPQLAAFLVVIPFLNAQRLGDDQAIDVGENLIQGALDHHREIYGGAKFSGESGILLAEGDSWFSYPGADVISRLEWNFDYDVRSVAKHGDTLESMVYDRPQLEKLVAAASKIEGQGGRPRAVLLSGGGNDVVGRGLWMLLNHKNSGLPPTNSEIVQSIINHRLRPAMISMLAAVTHMNDQLFEGEQRVPIIIHGYDFPYPDGRGFKGGFWVLPGPWLQPVLEERGYPTSDYDLLANRNIIQSVLEELNQMLASLPQVSGFEHVHFLDLRGLLQEDHAHKRTWQDEMHPSRRGFQLVAARYDGLIRSLP